MSTYNLLDIVGVIAASYDIPDKVARSMLDKAIDILGGDKAEDDTKITITD